MRRVYMGGRVASTPEDEGAAMLRAHAGDAVEALGIHARSVLHHATSCIPDAMSPSQCSIAGTVVALSVAPLSAMWVEPCSSTSAPRRVSSFMTRAMILCSTVCSASSVGAGTSV